MSTAADQVARSVRAYSKRARSYDAVHQEIFNEVEQKRLRETVERVVGIAGSGSPRGLRALDVGCGTGNLTAHFLSLGLETVSADVSPAFLRQVEDRFGDDPRSSTFRLDGQGIAGIAADTFDIAAAYSVLHHVPDYLAMVDELARVVKPGGVVYIDHEAAPSYWSPDGAYLEFKAAVRRARRTGPPWNRENKPWRRFLDPAKYAYYVHRAFNRRYQAEGDIHVWPDDHVEWDVVEARLAAAGAAVVWRDEYLVYRSEYPAEVWERYRDECSDMRLVVAQLPRTAPDPTRS
jgi:ubiquinone/menaquinone biosynthesis C-methylase UbiE